MEFINFKDVYKVYKNGVTAVADLNLKIEKGDFYPSFPQRKVFIGRPARSSTRSTTVAATSSIVCGLL